MRMWPVLLLFSVSCSLFERPSQSLAPGRSHPTKRSVAQPVQEKKEIQVLRDEALLKKIRSTNVIVIDVRTPEEFVNGHVLGSKNIDFLKNNFEEEVGKLNPKKRYLLYCASGNRSGKALQYFLARGVKAEALEPYESLKSKGIPLEGLSP